jgi:hypothetical protein
MELEDGLCERCHLAFGEGGGGELGFSEVNIFILKALEVEERTVRSRQERERLFSFSFL